MQKFKGIMIGIVIAIVGVIALGKIVPALWPEFVGSGTDVAALTQTDAATKTFQAFWPIVLLIVGIILAVAVLMWAFDAIPGFGKHKGR